MLAVLKVPSFTCKCVFYLQELNIMGDLFKKRAIFNVLMTITLEGNKITGQMIPFFLSTFWILCISFLHLKTSNIQFMRPTFVSKV